MKKFLFCVTACLALAACNNEKEYTVDELMKDDATRELLVSECKNNPGKLRDTPNCVNAGRANYLTDLDRMRKSLSEPPQKN